MASYGVALYADSTYSDLAGDVAFWHCDTLENVKEAGYPVDYGVTEANKF